MEIFVYKDDERHGPFRFVELTERMRAGDFSAFDLMWRAGMAEWQPIMDAFTLEEHDLLLDVLFSPPPRVVLPRLGPISLKGVDGLLGFWCVPHQESFMKLPIRTEYCDGGRALLPTDENWTYYPGIAVWTEWATLAVYGSMQWVEATIQENANDLSLFACQAIVERALERGWLFVLQVDELAVIRASTTPPIFAEVLELELKGHAMCKAEQHHLTGVRRIAMMDATGTLSKTVETEDGILSLWI
jgi:hypothetical protein